MRRELLLIALLFLTLAQTQGVSIGSSPCPRNFQIGSVITARITIAQEKGIIPLMSQIDLQCYNYTLPYQFARPPSIALALHDFQAKKTSHLYFTLKPLPSQSRAFVPLLIRTQWRYTEWVKISFSLLAEDRSDFEAGYYQLDTGLLGSCVEGKTNNFLLPFRQIQGYIGINHHVFLHGFQISTQLYTTSVKSPFELQIVHTSTSLSGISILFSLTTITQVHTIVVSYIVWDQTNLDVVSGNYILPDNVGAEISHTPDYNIGRNFARIFGITGFIIVHKNQDIMFNTEWTGNKFLFILDASRPLIKYLSYQYLFFVGSICSACPGYPYIYDGKCYQFCPKDTYASSENVCVDCGEGYYWNGTTCVKLCASGQILNIVTNDCDCPTGYFWNDFICLHCKGGRIFDQEKKVCRCPDGTRWNGYGCATLQCQNGQVWDPFSYSCICPSNSFKNGEVCVKKAICRNGKVITENNTCICPNGTHQNQNTGYCEADGCTGGRFWDKSQKICVCPEGQFFNGTLCLICINGQQWNSRRRRCECPTNYTWNGNWCELDPRCSGNRVFNKTFGQCVCRNGQFWNGFECKIQPQCCCGKIWNTKQFKCECPSSFNWDGQNCVLCINGKTWNQTTRQCECRPGTVWNNQFCVVVQDCYGGMTWVQSTWSCQCPAVTVWNGNFCIANPCIGGKIWDNFQRECVCLAGRVFVNGLCLPPEVACSNERVWDNRLYVCVCPDGYWDNGFRCIEIPRCPDGSRRNPLNGRCEPICPPGFAWIETKNECLDPTCPQLKRWDGNGCIDIDCPPNSYFNGTQCVCPDPEDLCKPWQYWDGTRCVFHQMICPEYTTWNGTFCIPQVANCPVGFYGNGVTCKPFPQLCPPPSVWAGDKCSVTTNCPHSTYFKGGSCFPYVPCQNGQSWDEDMINCICPQGTEWNGNRCLACSGGKIWIPFVGCQCPTGSFEIGLRCESVSEFRCGLIPFSFWDGNQCVCHEGFDSIGLLCVCEGVAVGNRCDRCAHRRNSEWRYGMCRCKRGYTQQGLQCLANQVGSDSPDQCNPATFFDSQLKRCIACPSGCLSCESSFKCTSCSLDFNFNPALQLCTQHCGDGHRYIDECDDGNDIPGDGCASDCTVENRYICLGGSPNNADKCMIYLPDFVTLKRTGQIRYPTKIVLNVQIDYLPELLLQSPECSNGCDGIFDIDIIAGDSQTVSISSKYIAGTAYTFAVQIEFGRPYIGKFTVRIGVDNEIGKDYFGNVDYSTELILEINPAIMSVLSDQIDQLL